MQVIGGDPRPIAHPQVIHSAMIVGIAVGGVLILLIVIDLLCCLLANAGLFAMVCRRHKRSPSDLEDDQKLGR